MKQWNVETRDGRSRCVIIIKNFLRITGAGQVCRLQSPNSGQRLVAQLLPAGPSRLGVPLSPKRARQIIISVGPNMSKGRIGHVFLSRVGWRQMLASKQEYLRPSARKSLVAGSGKRIIRPHRTV